MYAVLALTMAAPAGACGNQPVFPLDVDPPRTSTSTPVALPSPTTSAPTRRPARPPRPTPTLTASPTASTACLGPVEVVFTAEEELALRTSLCIAVGGVLRIEGQGPGTVSVDPPESVDQSYEAGVVWMRFLFPGTVVVSIDRDAQLFTTTVVVR